MNDRTYDDSPGGAGDATPGVNLNDERGESIASGLRSYVIGLTLALLLTGASFWAAGTHLIYGPGVSAALVTLAIAQMAIHLIFFLHITTAPDHTNNVLALAFGIFVVFLVVIGSVWIMTHLNHMLVMNPNEMMQMQ